MHRFTLDVFRKADFRGVGLVVDNVVRNVPGAQPLTLHSTSPLRAFSMDILAAILYM
jgi:hypothetical protein